MRFTKIVCTLGPATRTPDQIRALAEAGMNVARLNMSHGTKDEHKAFIQTIREINEERSRSKPYRGCIGILMDIRGAEVRTEDVPEPVPIRKGEEVLFSFAPLPGESRTVIRVNHRGFAQDARQAERILLDNGELTFDIVSIDPPAGGRTGIVAARAREDGKIGSRRHVNLPGADLDLPSITDKDWEDIAFGIEENVDFLGLSFIREAWEVEQVKDFARKRKSPVQVMAKIETRQGVENIGSIIEASDCIMVARGDLGAEVPFERLPVIQDEIVTLCRDAAKPVIVATQMLESMIAFPMPTRAEVTDIAHAAQSATDATMLSGETANGKNPLAAVVAMDRVLRATEEHLARLKREEGRVRTDDEARALAAVSLTQSDRAEALVVMTRMGNAAREISKFRPRVPVIACTKSDAVERQLQLSYGIFPLALPFSEDPEETVIAALGRAKDLGLLKTGDRVVLVTDIKAKDASSINSIQLRTVE